MTVDKSSIPAVAPIASSASHQADPLAEVWEGFPPVLYIPTTSPADDEANLLMLQLPSGQIALPTFSSLDRLTDSMSPTQPWVALRLIDVAVAQKTVHFDTIVIDSVPELEA